jgi:hypothetical protein
VWRHPSMRSSTTACCPRKGRPGGRCRGSVPRCKSPGGAEQLPGADALQLTLRFSFRARLRRGVRRRKHYVYVRSSVTRRSYMPQYEAVAHVFWELPFPLRLPPNAIFTWEPAEGVALFDPRPDVGELAWKRRCHFLQATEVFPDTGPPNHCYPVHDYLIASRLRSGREIKTAQQFRRPLGRWCNPSRYPPSLRLSHCGTS